MTARSSNRERCSAASMLSVALASAVIVLAGCGASAAPPGQSGSTAPAQQRGPSQAATQPAATPSTTTPSTPRAVAAGPRPCSASGLHVSVGAGNGAAGSTYYPLEFTNITGASCTMYGYPGVSSVTRPGGAQIGGAAIRNPTFPKELVTLAPGATAHASLRVVNAQDYPAALCVPVTVNWLRIFPPDSYVPIYTAFTVRICSGNIPGGSTLGIYVVRPGTTGP